MCGIVGIVGSAPVSDRIFGALRKLEYRGYDSAGIATLSRNTTIERKAVGKLGNLGNLLNDSPLEGNIGIGHTRWATHGAPTTVNAHPHRSGNISVVHNGIIENYQALRSRLQDAGFRFQTETDTETVAVLFDYHYQKSQDPLEALRGVLAEVEGAFALGIIIEGHENQLLAARRGSPLAIGLGHGEHYIGSDAIALADFTDRVVYLMDGDYAVLGGDDVKIYDALDNPVDRPVKIISIDKMMVDKGEFRHFMAKEIHDQPIVSTYALSYYLNRERSGVQFPNKDKLDFKNARRVVLVACGTASYAGLTSKYWFENWAELPVEVDIASEFRYREPPLNEQDIAIFISQSGETADTLAALLYAKSKGARTIAVVNTDESSIAREADIAFPIKAGPELSVASTKGFTSQLIALAAIALTASESRGTLSQEAISEITEGLATVPRLFSESLAIEGQFADVAKWLAKARDVLFLGRGNLFPIALEGALKLKEISYIHAEGYASGELKHGPIALIDSAVPVIVMAPSGRLYEKSISNMQEVMARGGQIMLITDEKGKANAPEGVKHTIVMPDVPDALVPIVYAIPVQLLAYYTATEKGTDVDQPRNLAKSVTVE